MEWSGAERRDSFDQLRVSLVLRLLTVASTGDKPHTVDKINVKKKLRGVEVWKRML